MTLKSRLLEWAQNEEMVDHRYTAHGNDCREAAVSLDSLTADLATERNLRLQAQHERDGMLGMRQEVLHYQKEFHRIKDERDALRERVAALERSRADDHEVYHQVYSVFREASGDPYLGCLEAAQKVVADRDQWKARCEMVVPLLREARDMIERNLCHYLDSPATRLRDRADAALRACEEDKP